MITVMLKQLKGWNACPDQLAIYKKHFGAGSVEVTRTRLLKARKLGLGVAFWFAHHSPGLYDDYEAKRKPLYDDYEAKRINLIADMLGLE